MKYKISASQISLFIDIQNGTDDDPWGESGCPRRWGFRYNEKVRAAPSEALQFGSAVHNCLHDYFTFGPDDWARKWPPEYVERSDMKAKVAALATAMLTRRPRVPGISEPAYLDKVPELNTSIHVKTDWHSLDKTCFVDWKTTSAGSRRDRYALQSPSFYLGGKAPREAKLLSEDPQARIYARGLMRRWGTEQIDALWVYGSKRFGPGGGTPPLTWTVKHTFHRDETEEWVQSRIWPVIRLMNSLRQAWTDEKLTSSKHLPHNSRACKETGRFCDALHQCQFEPSLVTLDDMTRALKR